MLHFWPVVCTRLPRVKHSPTLPSFVPWLLKITQYHAIIPSSVCEGKRHALIVTKYFCNVGLRPRKNCLLWSYTYTMFTHMWNENIISACIDFYHLLGYKQPDQGYIFPCAKVTIFTPLPKKQQQQQQNTPKPLHNSVQIMPRNTLPLIAYQH